MSTVETTSATATGFDAPGTVSTTRNRRLAVRLAALVLTVAALLGNAASADAMDVGGGFLNDTYNVTWTSTPGSAVRAVECSSGTIRINPYVNVLSGYTNGQWISYRYRLIVNSTGYTYTYPFTQATWVPGSDGNYQYPMKPLQGMTLTAHGNWRVEVQVIYWTASGWYYDYWRGPSGGYSQPGSTFTWAGCWT